MPSKHALSGLPKQIGDKTVLIATTGLSPAILTETVWALARETPPVIPDLVIVLTTKTGGKKIEEQLFGSDAVWRQLRRSILGRNAHQDKRLDFDTAPDRLKIAHAREAGRRMELDGLVTRDHHNAFADAIMNELYSWTSRGTPLFFPLGKKGKNSSRMMAGPSSPKPPPATSSSSTCPLSPCAADSRTHSASRPRTLKRLPAAVWRHLRNGPATSHSNSPPSESPWIKTNTGCVSMVLKLN